MGIGMLLTVCTNLLINFINKFYLKYFITLF
jgi:hypothetical protein